MADERLHQHAEHRLHLRAMLAGRAEQAREEAILREEFGVDPRDPDLDRLLREQAAGCEDELPFGVPGEPFSHRSPLVTGLLATTGVVLALLLALAAYQARGILILLLAAFFLATGLNPVVRALQRRRVRRGWAVTLVAAGFVALLVTFSLVVVPPLTSQVEALREAAPGYARELRDASSLLTGLDERFGLVDTVDWLVDDERMAVDQPQELVELAGRVVGIGAAAVTLLALTLLFLAGFERITQAAYQLLPKSRRARVSLLADGVLQGVGGYLLGTGVTSIIAGVITGVFLALVGVPQPVALAFGVAVLDLIPLVGATLAAIVCIGVALTVSLPVGIAVAVFMIVYQQIENWWLVPRVMERTVNISALATIVAALIGAALLGLLGALLAVPAAAAVQLIVREVWVPRQATR